MASMCSNCNEKSSSIKRSLTGARLCKECFFTAFETEVHNTIISNNLFTPGDVVALGASGGKDSTVLAYVMNALNKKYDYGIKLYLLSIDEGITGYRDDSLRTVKRNKEQYGLPLKILSYEELYKGWTMDKVVKKTGFSNNCTFCGVFRRQALDRGATLIRANKVVTGHNADDMAETVLMNIFRGDINRLGRCTDIVTGDENSLPRCKPFKYCFEREIVLYAHFRNLDYFSTECIYSPEAYRGHVREFIKDIEDLNPALIIEIIKSGEHYKTDLSKSTEQKENINKCEKCGYMTSRKICKACVLLEGLNKNMAKVSLGNNSKNVFSNPETEKDIASGNKNSLHW